MWMRKISVGFDRPSTPHDRLFVLAQEELRQAHVIYPNVGRRIARTETQRLGNVGFCFFRAPDKSLTDPDREMRIGEIVIQGQGMLAFSDSRRSPLGEYVDQPQCHGAER